MTAMVVMVVVAMRADLRRRRRQCRAAIQAHIPG
jgi:hypothetical protein